jgi:capsular exopolysaccharide synthesis family protein
MKSDVVLIPDPNALGLRAPLSTAKRADRSRRWLLRNGDELFRGLYTRAKLGWSQVIAVSSATAGEGKTTVCLGIASTIAQDFPERRILVVETDLYQPVLAGDFGIEERPGLIDCLVADRLLQPALRPTNLDNLWIMPSGGPSAEKERLLRTSRIEGLVENLRRQFDLVLLDAPAILTNSDGAPVASLADGVIFVVRAGMASAEQVDKALADIDPKRLRGTVLNATQTFVPNWLRRLFGFSHA